MLLHPKTAACGLLVALTACLQIDVLARPRPDNDAGTHSAAWAPGLINAGWTRKDGAPAGVYSIAQDANGLLWFAAADGLYSFDGMRFDRKDQVHGQAPLHTAALSVAADGDAIWVGYQFGGISVFRPAGARHFAPGKDGPAGAVFQISRMKDGTMWAATGGGMFRLDANGWHHAGKEQGLPDNVGPAFTVLPDGRMLVYSPDGVYRSVPARQPAAVRFEKVLDQPGVEGGELQPDGRVLINSQLHGMQILTPATGTVVPFRLRNDGLPMLGYYMDYRGGLWVNAGAAIQLLDRDGRVVQQFTPAHGFTGTTFTANFSDREGNVWFATTNGIDRVRQPRLTNVELPVGVTDALSVQAGDDGLVWIGNMLTQGQYKVPTFGLTRDGKRQPTGILNVTSSCRQSDGTNWFATPTAIWRKRAGTTDRWALPAPLAGADIQAIAVERDGTPWISIVGKGVYALRGGTWQPGGGRADLLKPTAVSMLADQRGRIWFGYVDNGMAMLDGTVLRRFGATDGLRVGNVLALADGGEHVWVGGDRGLAWFDGRGFVPVTESEAGAFRSVSGVVRRADGELWLHDADGLVRIAARALAVVGSRRPAAVPVERFDYLDGHEGVASQIRPLPSLAQGSDGKIWYATSSRVGWIDPAAIPRNPLPPVTMITAIRTDRARYRAIRGLVLPTHTTRIEIDFTAAALSIPERVRFRYRMAGADEGWRDAGTRRQAFYTNLAPGNYVFEVSAANEDGVWSRTPAQVPFSIDAAFTQTLWFNLGCGAAALAALGLLYRWRLHRATARIRADLDVRSRERERIARTLHDTFLQGVQALVFRFDAIMTRLPAGSPARTEMIQVLKQAQDVIREGRDEVNELRNLSTAWTAGEGLWQALERTAREIAPPDGVVLDMRCTGRARPLPADVELEVLTIVREALLNAFRHAAATKVTLALAYGANDLTITVRDDGVGIDKVILEAGGKPGHWGLRGMRERAAIAGARLSVDTSASGTTVTIGVPITSGSSS